MYILDFKSLIILRCGLHHNLVVCTFPNDVSQSKNPISGDWTPRNVHSAAPITSVELFLLVNGVLYGDESHLRSSRAAFPKHQK